MKELVIEILNFLRLAYWVEIITDNPSCTYYFGPFLEIKEAEKSLVGYVEDLKAEGTSEIKVQIKRCKPGNLTIFEEIDQTTKSEEFEPVSG